MTGAALIINYDDAAPRAAMTRVREFPGGRSSAMFAAIGGFLVSSSQLRFDTETGPDGTKWKPSQRVVKKGGKTLQLHGYLLGSLTYNVLGAGDGVEEGSPMAYAAAMQAGASITQYARSQSVFRKVAGGEIGPLFVKKSKANFESRVTIGEYTITIPARPYLGVSPADEDEIEEIVDRHLQAAMLGTSPGGALQ